MKLLLWYWGRRGHPSMVRGWARALAERSKEAQGDGQRLDVILSLSAQMELRQDLEATGLPIQWVNTYRSKAEFLLAFLRLPWIFLTFRNWLRQQAPDLVLCTMTHLWNPLMLHAVRGTKATLVLLVHDGTLHPGEDSGWRARCLRYELARTDYFLVMSAHVKQQLIALHGIAPDRIVCVPHGADHAASIGPGPRQLPDITRGEASVRLLFFGRLVAYKGLTNLVSAYGVLREAGVPVTLDVVGSGDPSEAQRIAMPFPEAWRRDIHWDVRWIDEEEIDDILSGADIVVLPYVEASQSGVVPAATMRGIPVVVTPVGALSEQVIHQQTGLVAASSSPADIAEAISTLIHQDGLYPQCSEGALRHGRTSLEWAAVAEQVVHAADRFLDMKARR